ncbi:MAG: magnesium chelatase subunit I [Planctomycetota bacterium]|jgi:magnesium chelatase subunit I
MPILRGFAPPTSNRIVERPVTIDSRSRSTNMNRPKTLAELEATGYRSRSVKQEMRENLMRKLRDGEPMFEGIIGYEKTVIPQIQSAVLSRHDFILLGLRGQAKTRLLRSLNQLLDEFIPAVDGCELNDDPLNPVAAGTKRRLAEEGGALPIRWIPREERYREKLATPDVTIADLIGDVDPIKAATLKRDLSDPEVIHYGLLPRSNRGILAINELPDLQARIQVGLLNILEEGDIQIRGFPMRLSLDVCMVFTANPEDYTNRGSIITPLRDRIESQILTHYPQSLEQALAITEQEAWTDRDGPSVLVPDALRTIIEDVAFQARTSDLVDQASGVSMRMTIALRENVISSAERRAVQYGESNSVARISDLLASTAAISGKIELVYDGEREGVEAVSMMLLGRAVKAEFDRHFPDVYQDQAGSEASIYSPLLDWFRASNSVDISADTSTSDLLSQLEAVSGLADLVQAHMPAESDEERVANMELALEGLHQSSLLSRRQVVGGRVYGDMLAEMAQTLEQQSD